MKHKHLYGVILAGGSGTRLWPISRELYPKQLLSLLGNKTLIQQTFDLLSKVIEKDKIFVVTNDAFALDIYLQLRTHGFHRENILVEPSQRNTGPAIGFAAQSIHAKDSKATLLICPSDHAIKPATAFARDVETALPAAKKGKIVTFGITPTYPSTEYGYIESPARGASKKQAIRTVQRFVEKPHKEQAEEYVEKGFLWNSGMFLVSTTTILAAIKKDLPKVSKALAQLDADNFPIFAKAYDALPKISIDEGVMEKSRDVVVLPASFAWHDIGSWKSLHELSAQDKKGNVLNEHAIELDASNSLIQGTQNRVVAAVGIQDLIIVDTEDAVLVAHREETHRIKDVFNKLKEENRPQHLEHKTTLRPWGSYTILEEGPNYKVKKLVVNPNQSLSLQMHHKRSEHWVVVKGVAKATVGRDTRYLEQHHSVDIPKETQHRLENPGSEPLEIIEVQNGSYLGEDDIVRFEDNYERIV